jgi:glycolate oxidase FAD binding subunit
MVSVAARAGVLAGIVGNAHVREESGRLLVEPADEEQVAAVLGCAWRDRLTVVPRGGGSKLDWAPPASRCDVQLSTRRLDALVEHEPGDLVCVVQSGMRLDALQEAVAPHRQQLMLDPPGGPEATLGGIAAANAAGPLRTSHGTMRDLAIGARFVLADGTVGHSGGKVVKNVAGYDVAKLLVGSHGTLAVITQLALRLHPVPETSRTVAVDARSAVDAQSAWQAIDSAAVAIASAAVRWPQGTLLLRIDGTEQGVAAQVSTVTQHAAGARLLDDALAADAWQQSRNAPWSHGTAVAHAAVPRTRLADLLEIVDTVAHDATVLPSLGVADLQLDPGATREQVTALRARVEAIGGHLTVRRPGDALADVAWPSVDTGALDLMRAVKRALDPLSLLSSGRFLGGI